MKMVPSISMTPRRTEHINANGSSRRIYFPQKATDHFQTPLLRPLYCSIISRKSLDHRFRSISPGPTAYPMYEFDEDILPRPQPGFTQKHRFSSNRKPIPLQISPPFYYPNKMDRHRLPSFTIGKRFFTSKKMNQCAPPYYESFDDRILCSRIIRPGVTLKGRWSSLVYNGINYIPKVKISFTQHHSVLIE